MLIGLLENIRNPLANSGIQTQHRLYSLHILSYLILGTSNSRVRDQVKLANVIKESNKNK